MNNMEYNKNMLHYKGKSIKLIDMIFFFSWRDSPLVGLVLLLIHEDFCRF